MPEAPPVIRALLPGAKEGIVEEGEDMVVVVGG